MIRDSGAATTETWHGPFDPLPRPAVGNEMVTNRITQDLSLLRHQSYSLTQTVRESDVPQEYQELITEYYRKKIRDKEAELAMFSKPLKERRQEALDAFQKEMEARKTVQQLQQPRSAP